MCYNKIAMAERPQHDWEEIKAAYVTGKGITLRELAEKYGVQQSTLRNRASKDNWRQLRDEFREKVLAGKTEVAINDIVLERKQFDDLGHLIVDGAQARLAYIMQRDCSEYLNLEDLTEILDAAKKAQEIKYRALDIPAPKQIIEMDDQPFQRYQEMLAIEMAKIREGGNGNGADDKKEDGGLVPVKLVMPAAKN